MAGIYIIKKKKFLNEIVSVGVKKITSHVGRDVDIICQNYLISKVSDHSRGWPEGSLFDSYYTKV